MPERPRWEEEIVKRLAPLRLAPEREAEIADELAEHLEDHYERLLAGGATEAEAYQNALAGLSDSKLLAESLRTVERVGHQERIAPGLPQNQTLPSAPTHVLP